MERPSSNSPPAPVRRSQRSTTGRPANKYGDWDTRSSSSSIPSSSMSTRERRLAEASRQKQAADDELRRKELAILRMELELERNINEREYQEQLAKIEQAERADFLLAQPKKPEPKEEIAPATGQVLESTAHVRTVGAASAQRTEVSQRTLSHLPITSIDSHIPPPHSALNSSFALPLVQSDLNSSFALPPTHSALLPVNDIFLKQSPVHHSVTLGHAFTAPNHPPRTPIDQSTERELSLVAEVNRLHAQLRIVRHTSPEFCRFRCNLRRTS